MEIQDQFSFTSNSDENNPFPTPAKKKITIGFILGVILQSLLWVALVLIYLELIPNLYILFEDFGVEISENTKIVINVSYYFYTYRYIVLPLIVIFCSFDFVLAYYLFRRPQYAMSRIVWRLIMLAIPISFIGPAIGGFFIPLAKLFHDHP